MNTHQMYQQANAQWQPVMNNPAVPHPMLQPTSGKQVPRNYFSPQYDDNNHTAWGSNANLLWG